MSEPYWSALGGAPAPAPSTPGMMLIAQALLGVAGGIDITGIPGTYSHLELVVIARGDAAAVNANLRLRFNNDSGANYDTERTTASGGTAPAAGEVLAGTEIGLSDMPAASAPANVFAHQVYDIPGYSRTDIQKAISGAVGWKQGTSSGGMAVRQVSGWWRSVAAITRITLFANTGQFAAGSSYSLYGKV